MCVFVCVRACLSVCVCIIYYKIPVCDRRVDSFQPIWVYISLSPCLSSQVFLYCNAMPTYITQGSIGLSAPFLVNISFRLLPLPGLYHGNFLWFSSCDTSLFLHLYISACFGNRGVVGVSLWPRQRRKCVAAMGWCYLSPMICRLPHTRKEVSPSGNAGNIKNTSIELMTKTNKTVKKNAHFSWTVHFHHMVSLKKPSLLAFCVFWSPSVFLNAGSQLFQIFFNWCLSVNLSFSSDSTSTTLVAQQLQEFEIKRKSVGERVKISIQSWSVKQARVYSVNGNWRFTW